MRDVTSTSADGSRIPLWYVRGGAECRSARHDHEGRWDWRYLVDSRCPFLLSPMPPGKSRRRRHRSGAGPRNRPSLRGVRPLLQVGRATFAAAPAGVQGATSRTCARQKYCHSRSGRRRRLGPHRRVSRHVHRRGSVRVDRARPRDDGASSGGARRRLPSSSRRARPTRRRDAGRAARCRAGAEPEQARKPGSAPSSAPSPGAKTRDVRTKQEATR